MTNSELRLLNDHLAEDLRILVRKFPTSPTQAADKKSRQLINRVRFCPLDSYHTRQHQLVTSDSFLVEVKREMDFNFLSSHSNPIHQIISFLWLKAETLVYNK